jgi:peptidoglycan/LPS O-acetylase OafA/YrhL
MKAMDGTGRRLLAIEYLRGLASLAVAWFHLTNQYAMDWVRASGSLGYLGV